MISCEGERCLVEGPITIGNATAVLAESQSLFTNPRMVVDLVGVTEVDSAAVSLLSPENSGATHLHALAAISRLMRDERVHEALSDAPTPEALYGLLTNAADRHAA